MVTAEITDSVTTITFELYTSIDHSLQAQKIFSAALQKGRGQRVRNPGMWFEAYKFTAVFKSIVAGDSAWEQYDTFIDFCKTRNGTYEYQRKLTYTIPGTASDKELNGQLSNLAINSQFGADEQKVIFGFDFLPDNISKQVP